LPMKARRTLRTGPFYVRISTLVTIIQTVILHYGTCQLATNAHNAILY